MKPHVVIIGAGPAGASAAIYLARFCHNVTLIDAGSDVPGRTSMAPDIENFLGHSQAESGADFLARIQTQLNQLSIQQKHEKVIHVSKNSDGLFTIKTNQNTDLSADYVVLAIGLSDVMPDIEGLDPYYEHAIFHCLTCNWYQNRDKKLAIVANNDRGITTALMLAALHMPPKLTVIPSQTPEFSQTMIDRAEANDIAVYQSPLQSLDGENGYLQAVTLADGTNVETEVLFTKLGHTRFDDFLDSETLQLTRESSEGFIIVNFQTFESSVKNLFAVGPCNNGPDQAIIAAGQGATAALEIHSRIVSSLGI